MYGKVIDAIVSELRVKRCLRDIGQFWGYRSTVPGPGLKAASEFLCRRYREEGIQAEVVAYPADDRTEWLPGHRNPLAWFPRAACLAVAQPLQQAGPICSYDQEPLCLVCNSTATPPGGVDAPVVYLPSGVKDEDYGEVDVAGRIILTDAPARQVQAQARKRGALGVISDCICPPWLNQDPPEREPEDTPDLTLWDVFSGRRADAPLWGFSLSTRQGRRLKQLLRSSPESVVLHAEVDAELVEGTSELTMAVLPGTDLAEEEVWLLAHSSEPGAEDNASGCCLGVEIARTLRALIARGALPPLRRTIRFLHAVEVQGYLPYITSRRASLHRVVAGLCCDAMGMDYTKVCGALELGRSPEANASFVDGLAEHLAGLVAAVPVHCFTDDNFAPFPWHMGPFTGNDAFIAHGCFDIPTPEVTNWPERFYHSSQDTVDTLSENTLARCGTLAAAYAYVLATAGRAEALSFAALAAADWKRRTAQALAEAAIAPDPDLEAHATRLYTLGRHLGLQAVDAVRSVRRLDGADEVLAHTVEHLAGDLAAAAELEAGRAAELAAALAGRADVPAPPVRPQPPAPGKVVTRTRWEAPKETDFSAAGQVTLVALRERGPVEHVWEWINGRRNVAELWERVQYGGEVPPEAVAAYVELLLAEGLVTIR